MKTPPLAALFEAELSSTVVLFDVSHLLPVGSKEYKTRSVPAIDRLFVHKSGADGPPGYKGVVGMASYCVEPKPKGRGFPGAPYTFWISREPDFDERGRYVVYRCQPDRVQSYHSGPYANERGVAVAVQGNYDSEWDLLQSGQPRITREPSDAQVKCLEALVDWAIARYRLQLPEGLSGHWEAPKPKRVCPGDFLRAWVVDRRGSLPKLVENGTVAIPVSSDDEIEVSKPPIRVLQKALFLLGHDPGPMDGLWGYRSRRALESFQRSHGLADDGWYGPLTATHLLAALRVAGLASRSAFEAVEVDE